MDICLLQQLYCGFDITSPSGNNAFSYPYRSVRRIHVPPLGRCLPGLLAVGLHPVFVEMENGVERVCTGLREWAYFDYKGVPVFVFDNHNHALVFWAAGKVQGVFGNAAALVHVDQHKDTRAPEASGFQESPSDRSLDGDSLVRRSFQAANYELNVGNFIPPALRWCWFNSLIQVGCAEGLEVALPASFVLDIDLDFFAPVMDYVPRSRKIGALRSWISRAAMVTVATSPYFMDQQQALDVLQELF